MLKYITDKTYISLLGGNSIPDNFDKLVIEASNYINRQTHGRIDKNNVSEQVQYVTCLIIDALKEKEAKINEIGNLKSQNIEGWSETYSTPKEIEKDYSDKMQNILLTYLWDEIGTDGLPLLYSGVC